VLTNGVIDILVHLLIFVIFPLFQES